MSYLIFCHFAAHPIPTGFVSDAPVFEYILSNAIILIHRHLQQEILTTYPTVGYRFS